MVKPQGYAGGLELRGRIDHLRPGLRRLVRIEPGLLEGVLVVVEDGRRAVERELSIWPLARVVAGHGREIGLRVELLAGVLHHLGHRLDGALAAIMVAVPTSNTCMMCGALPARNAAMPAVMVGIAALVGRHDLVFVLAALNSLARA